MKWTVEDLEKYVQAKEYIDTLIIPLIPFQLQNETTILNEAFQETVLRHSTHQIEDELSGRVMLTPQYTYIKSSDLEDEVNRLNQWVTHLKEQPFKSVFFVTFDMQWKKVEQELEGHLIWLPIGKKADINSQEAKTVIHNQVEQISEFIRMFW
ncbi:MAG TPA: DUF2487 family protein [Pseudogracilibacillus sp.]|nr:DUF2487 family protein [Pseudogracilibacillus sp.]